MFLGLKEDENISTRKTFNEGSSCAYNDLSQSIAYSTKGLNKFLKRQENAILLSHLRLSYSLDTSSIIISDVSLISLSDKSG